MDINLLVLNVGNSRLAIGTFVAGELAKVVRLPHAQRGDWEARIAEAWAAIDGAVSPTVAGACVNTPLMAPVAQAVLAATGKKIQWVGKDLDLPISVLTESPKETGVDRVLNVAAAYEQMGKACVVVDAGSAVTVDCCNDNGDFLGGAIAPGLSMMLAALHERTAALPKIDFESPQGNFGKSTREAILQGVYHGIRGLVREVVENYATELTVWPEIIATGGDAQKLFAGWDLIHAISPDLTLYGIALAYVDHNIRHET